MKHVRNEMAAISWMVFLIPSAPRASIPPPAEETKILSRFKYSKRGKSKAEKEEFSDEPGSEYSTRKEVHGYKPGFAYREGRPDRPDQPFL
jgi:hypothetical protein